MEFHVQPGSTAPHVAFNQRWGLLRPVIERLYLDENRRLSEVIEIMKTEHGFDAVYVLNAPF